MDENNQESLLRESQIEQQREDLNFIVDKNLAHIYTDPMFDPFKSPPNLELAVKHGISRRVCRDISKIQQIDSKKEICPCCGLSFENELIPVCSDPKELSHLGTCFPLYFNFIKLCSLIIIIQVSITAIPSIIYNSKGHECESIKFNNFMCYFSFANIISQQSKNTITIEGGLNLIFLLCAMVLIQMFQIYQRVQRQKIQNDRVSVADFSIMISGLSKGTSAADLQNIINNALKKNKQRADISKVYLLYDLKDYANLYSQKRTLVSKRLNLKVEIDDLKQKKDESPVKESQNKAQLQSLKANVKKIQEAIADIEEKMIVYERELTELETNNNPFSAYRQIQSRSPSKIIEKYSVNEAPNEASKSFDESQIDAKDRQEKLQFSGKAIVTFNNQQMCNYIRRYYKISGWKKFIYDHFRGTILDQYARQKLHKYMYKDHFFKVKQAPEPSDIIWNSIGSTANQDQFRWISGIICFFVITLAFGLLLYSKKFIKVEQQSMNQYLSMGFSFGAATLVALTNTILGIIIRRFAAYQQHNKQTTFFVSVGKKLVRVFILNMVLSTLLANMVFHFLSQNKKFNVQGLVSDYFFMFITNSYLSSLFNYFDIVWGFRLFQRWKAQNQKDQCTLTQIEAHQIFEGHPVDMALRYANILKTVLYMAAVSPFIPLGVPMTSVAFIIIYWVDKYLLLRRYVCSNYLSYKLSKKMLNLLALYPVYFSMGNFISMFIPIDQQVQDSSHFVWPDPQQQAFFYLALSGMLVALIAYFFPFKGAYSIYQVIFGDQLQKKKIDSKYNNIADDLKDDYHHHHPILQEYTLEASVLRATNQGKEETNVTTSMKVEYEEYESEKTNYLVETTSNSNQISQSSSERYQDQDGFQSPPSGQKRFI